jgi:hypothetical protein
MKTAYKNSLKYKILKRIENIPGNVILHSDFRNLGSYRQIGRILNTLIDEKKLARISFGIYAKAEPSEYIEEPILKTSFDAVTKEALNRMNIKWDLTTAQKAYNDGKTTQIPVRPGIRLRSRCRRDFSFGNLSLKYENNTYAR